MYTTVDQALASTIWWALIVGLLVQGFVIYVAVRFALFHHRLMIARHDEPVDEVATSHLSDDTCMYCGRAIKVVHEGPPPRWEDDLGDRKCLSSTSGRHTPVDVI